MDLRTNQKSSAPFLNPLCVALDLDDRARLDQLVSSLSELVGGFKIGPRLINVYGQEIISSVSKKAPVFVDCKYFDIPSTMEAAIRSAFHAGASACTIHALSGRQALELMAQLEAELSQIRPFRIFAVSILTSWDETSFPPVFKSSHPENNVIELVSFAEKCGLSSFVCSASELLALKSQNRYFVVPGIRFEKDSTQDQSRVGHPRQAITDGASLLVVGRPIIEAQDPVQKTKDFLITLQSAFK